MLKRPLQPAPRPAAIANWLFAVAALVLAMIVVGGITRLTESGLSITRWEPVTGILPPIGEAQWQAEFDLYRATPQYQLINRGMSLDEFKFIYFWEYLHRLIGRLIGLAFALPLLWFWWRRAIPQGQTGRLVALLVLGGLQGAIGWWMVASGLVDRPEVSHIRLAVHLLLAFAIFGALVWVALDHLRLARRPEEPPPRMPTLAIWTLSLLFLQFLFGAYVAGLEAGYAFNTWPRMGEEWFPSDTPMEGGLLANLADNPIVVQFVHRWLAFVVAGFVLAMVSIAWVAGRRAAAAGLFLALFLQVQLGILTLLSGVEIKLGVAHQAMAAVLLGAVLVTAYRLGTRPREAAAPAAAETAA